MGGVFGAETRGKEIDEALDPSVLAVRRGMAGDRVEVERVGESARERGQAEAETLRDELLSDVGQRALERLEKAGADVAEVLADEGLDDLGRLGLDASAQPHEQCAPVAQRGQAVRARHHEGGEDRLEVQAVAGGGHAVKLLPETEGDDDDDGGVTPAPVPPVDPGGEPPASGDAPDLVAVDGPSWIESPWVFGFWVLATAGVGGATIWSGIDTVNNPGTEVVEQECAGQGTDCPEYQQGLKSQLLTNILIGATAGTAAVATIFAIFVTDWDGEPDGETAVVTPYVEPTGAGIGVGGRF